MGDLSQKKDLLSARKNNKSLRYLEELMNSVRYVYEKSGDYFTSTKGRERSMVFRIAHRLAPRIEGEGVFVDIEATRCNDDVKRCQNSDSIRPDMIIHERNSTGYIVAEFKCYHDGAAWIHDFSKLEYLTTPKDQRENSNSSTPYYKLGLFIYLTDAEQDIQVRLYENGENVTDRNPYQRILRRFKNVQS